MNRQIHKGPADLLSWMGGLADGTRLRILSLLADHELGVAELCEILQMPQSTVSRHLKLLGDQGWVRHRRLGTAHLYRADSDTLAGGQRGLWGLVAEQTRGWSELEQDRLRLREHLARRGSDSRRFFAGAASEWDAMRGELYGESFAAAAVCSLLPAEWIVADLGCGTGQLTEELARRVRRVIGVDHSGEMLDAARRRLAERANVELHAGELEDLPIESGRCDAALMLLVLTYVETPADALSEMLRIVRPGGRIVVVDLLEHGREDFRAVLGQRHLGFSAEALGRMLEERGATDVRAHALAPDPRAKGPALILASGARTVPEKTR